MAVLLHISTTTTTNNDDADNNNNNNISNAPKGNGIGATGSKSQTRVLRNHAEQRNTRVLICTGVLRTRCPYSVALRGFADNNSANANT